MENLVELLNENLERVDNNLWSEWLDDDHKKLIEEQVQTLEQEFKDNERVLNSLKVVRKELQVNINKEQLKNDYVRHTVALDKIPTEEEIYDVFAEVLKHIPSKNRQFPYQIRLLRNDDPEIRKNIMTIIAKLQKT